MLQHPEQQEGEVFFGNCIADRDDFDRISWKTKRMGNIAYERDGKILPRLHPVFVKKSELDEAGVTLSDPYGSG